jgi:hypothetical protein
MTQSQNMDCVALCIHYQSFKEFGARVGQRNEIRKPIPKDPRAINGVYLQNY